MSLYHGTSASAALRILEKDIAPSHNGFFYCFASEKPESRAGALCFATGVTLRRGSVDTRQTLSQYFSLNPDFPKGLKGVFCKAALNVAIASWKKTQESLSAPPYPDHAAIIVFKPHAETVHVHRQGGFVNEVKIPASALPTLEIEKAYFDDTLMNAPEVLRLKNAGIAIAPLSAWTDMIQDQVRQAKPAKDRHQGPK